MKKLLFTVALVSSLVAMPAREAIVVLGASGDDEYAKAFADQAAAWSEACAQGGVACKVLGDAEGATMESLQEALAASASEGELWLVLIGHGTYDGRVAKFNLRDEDPTAEEFAESVKAHTGPLIVINTAASSAPFVPALSGKGRVIVTATKSGDEINAPHFGRYFVDCLADPEADLNGDGQISVLEASVGASARVAEFFETEERLLTEHAMIDDNGDGKGTRADWYRGTRLEKRPKGEKGIEDGRRAGQIHLIPSAEEAALSEEQRTERDALELEIFALRERRKELGDPLYYNKLEELAIKLAGVYGSTQTAD